MKARIDIDMDSDAFAKSPVNELQAILRALSFRLSNEARRC